MKRLVAVALLLAAMAVLEGAKVKIHTEHDKDVSFRDKKTWAWSKGGAGEVKMLVTANDDPEAMRQRFEPVIIQAAEHELSRRGLVKVTDQEPDLYLNYYLLITAGASSQYMGQFLPSSTEWGLPAISFGTSALRAFAQGSLVLDFVAPELESVVWRGVAQAEIDLQRTEAQRQQRVREAIRDILAKFPPKQ